MRRERIGSDSRFSVLPSGATRIEAHYLSYDDIGRYIVGKTLAIF